MHHFIVPLRYFVFALSCAMIVSVSSCREAADEKVEVDSQDAQREIELTKQIARIESLHTPMGPSRRGDWLTQHEEPGQTFAEYLQSDPVRPLGKRRVIYIQPIGDFSMVEKKIVHDTADFMGVYFNVAVKVRKTLALSEIPEKARRIHPSWGDRQILTTYVLNDVLKPQLPDDAACLIAFTAHDLWPGEGWNFVFGQASLRERVGVWSMYRNGDPERDEQSCKECLMRTLKTAVHETGHMFSMPHCTAYECDMCGSNNRSESDHRDVWMCPQCVAKVCWTTRTNIVDRYQALRTIFEKHGFEKEAKFCRDSIQKLAGEQE